MQTFHVRKERELSARTILGVAGVLAAVVLGVAIVTFIFELNGHDAQVYLAWFALLVFIFLLGSLGVGAWGKKMQIHISRSGIALSRTNDPQTDIIDINSIESCNMIFVTSRRYWFMWHAILRLRLKNGEEQGYVITKNASVPQMIRTMRKAGIPLASDVDARLQNVYVSKKTTLMTYIVAFTFVALALLYVYFFA